MPAPPVLPYPFLITSLGWVFILCLNLLNYTTDSLLFHGWIFITCLQNAPQALGPEYALGTRPGTGPRTADGTGWCHAVRHLQGDAMGTPPTHTPKSHISHAGLTQNQREKRWREKRWRETVERKTKRPSTLVQWKDGKGGKNLNNTTGRESLLPEQKKARMMKVQVSSLYLSSR